jgi:diguanylate cyclase (GGDEF)-like protein
MERPLSHLEGTGATWPGRASLAGAEHTSLEQRLGALQLVRLAIVALVVAAAWAVPGELGMTLDQVMARSLAYLGVCVGGQLADMVWQRGASPSDRSRSGAPFQQMLLPVDTIYLAVLALPSGGAQSDFILLFTVQLISVTLLASPRAGIRLAMWDSVLLLAVTWFQLGGPLGQWLGTPQLVTPSAGAVVARIGGFWAVALTTASFSALSERELRRSKAHLDALTTMASQMEEAMESGCEPEEIAVVLLKGVLYPFDFKQVAVVWERKGDALAARFAAGTEEVVPVPAGPPGDDPLESALAARALGANQPVLVRDLAGEGGEALATLVPGATNVVVVPLKAGREGQGLLLAESGPPPNRRMSRRSLDMVSRFAAHAALALRNADLKAEIARLAASDPLTGLANRRALTTALAREVARSARTREPLSLAIMDIDFFKRINDTYGHVAGDDVLKEVAGAMASNVRDVDLVARYGGEEFAVVLPNCPSEGALTVVERVRAAVAALGTVTKVTVSAGISTATGDAGGGAEGLMAAADEALYASKRAGRDRATLAPAREAADAPGGRALTV